MLYHCTDYDRHLTWIRICIAFFDGIPISAFLRITSNLKVGLHDQYCKYANIESKRKVMFNILLRITFELSNILYVMCALLSYILAQIS